MDNLTLDELRAMKRAILAKAEELHAQAYLVAQEIERRESLNQTIRPVGIESRAKVGAIGGRE